MEYKFKMQKCIILYHKQKFHISEQNAFFFLILHFSPKVLKPIDFKFDVMSLINPCIKMPILQLNNQNVAKLFVLQ